MSPIKRASPVGHASPKVVRTTIRIPDTTLVVIRVRAIPKILSSVTVIETPVVKVARDVAADATKSVARKRRSGKKNLDHPRRRVASQMTKAETESETATIEIAITGTVTELAAVETETKTVTNDGTPRNVKHETVKRAQLARAVAPPFVAVL